MDRGSLVASYNAYWLEGDRKIKANIVRATWKEDGEEGFSGQKPRSCLRSCEEEFAICQANIKHPFASSSLPRLSSLFLHALPSIPPSLTSPSPFISTLSD